MRNRLLKAAWTLSACLPILALSQQAAAQGADGPHRENGWEYSLSGGLLRVDPFLRAFLTSGDIVQWIRLEGAVSELFDVCVLPGVRRPLATSYTGEELNRLFSIEAA